MKGHIRKRGRNSWELKFDAGRDPVTGRRVTRYRTVRGTRRDAQGELNRILVEIEGGSFVADVKVTVSEVARHWLHHVATDNNGQRSLERHEVSIGKHIIPHLGGIRLGRLTGEHIQQFYRQLRTDGNRRTGEGLSEQSVIHIHSALSLILGWCLRTRKIRVNPLHQVRRPSGTSRPEKAVEVGSEGDDFEDGGTVSVIQHGELKVLLAYLRGKSLYFPTLLAVSTGLRRGEVLGLKWGDMDLENGTLMVRRAVEQTRKYGLRLKVPKKHSRRQIALPKTVVGEIRRHRREQLELRMKLGMGKGDFVFSTWDGQLRSPGGFTGEFRRAATAAGLPRATFHMLRHTHASQLLSAGEPVTSVSRRLGHKNPAITLQVYSHVLEGMDDAAAGKTDQIMNAILYG